MCVADECAAAYSRPSKRRKRSRAKPTSAALPFLPFNALQSIFERCTGTSRLHFGLVCKLWKRVRDRHSTHMVQSPAGLSQALNVRAAPVCGAHAMIAFACSWCRMRSCAQVDAHLSSMRNCFEPSLSPVPHVASVCPIVVVFSPCSPAAHCKQTWRLTFLRSVQAAHPYDTLVLHPGLYKQRILCEVPLKVVSAAHHDLALSSGAALQACPRAPASSSISPPVAAAAAHAVASPQAGDTTPARRGPAGHAGIGVLASSAWLGAAPAQQGRATAQSLPPAAPLSSAAVTLWQERPPVLLSNTDACCLIGLTVRVAHASHEYSSVAYGTEARAIVMRHCHVMGGTGLRVPYPVDPLRVLLLQLQDCVVQVRALPRRTCACSTVLCLQEPMRIQEFVQRSQMIAHCAVEYCADCARPVKARR